jgi:hypothetical protein
VFGAALVWTVCYSEWLIGINGGFCVENDLLGFRAAFGLDRF